MGKDPIDISDFGFRISDWGCDVSLSSNIATRRNNWGRRAFGISRAGRIYLPEAVPAPKPTAPAGDDNAEAVASKLPGSASPQSPGNFEI